VVQSEETRFHLEDAHKRVLSIAAVQKQLHASGATGVIEIAPLRLFSIPLELISNAADSRTGN
jgi:two-component sensor histidine kinase